MHTILAKIESETLFEMLQAHEDYIQQIPDGKRLCLRYTDLQGAILQGRDLRGAEFIGCNFNKANLSNSILDYAKINGCDMRNSRLVRTSLEGADLCGTILAGADLSMANLKDAILKEGKVIKGDKGGHLSNYQHESRPVDASGAKFDGANLDNSQLSKIAAAGSSFQNCTLQGANLSGAMLKDCDFTGANLAGAQLNGAKIDGAIFHDTILSGTQFGLFTPRPETMRGALLNISPQDEMLIDEYVARLNSHQQWFESDARIGKCANFDNCDIRAIGAHFKARNLTAMSAQNAIGAGIIFLETQLQGANFEGADLRGACFINADLRGANFINSRLLKADFRYANLGVLEVPNNVGKIADFAHSDLRYATFDGANLYGANFKNALIEETSFKNANVLGKTQAQKVFVV